MWTCTLCTQAKNTQDKCMTCGRERDYQPRRRGATTRPQGLPPQAGHHIPPPVDQIGGYASDPKLMNGAMVLSQNAQLARVKRPNLGVEAYRGEPKTTIGYIWWIFWSFLFIFRTLLSVFSCGRSLKIDEQLQVEHFNGEITVENGPKFAWKSPCKRAVIVKAERLRAHEYLRIRNTLYLTERTEHGPGLVFLDAYEIIEEKGSGFSVSSAQYVLVEDKFSGQRKVVRGPLACWHPGPREEGQIKSSVRLSCTEYVCIQNSLTGEKRIHKGPDQYFPDPYDAWVLGQSVWLSSTQYLKVHDTRTGQVRIDQGPRQWFPLPYDEWEFGESVWLTGTEYVMVQDKQTGKKRVEKGPRKWFPEPYDEWEVASCLTLNNMQYIHVLNKENGTTETVKGPCIWCPRAYDSASEVKEAFVLQCDEYVNLKDVATGERWIHRGRGLLHLEPTWRIESTSGSNGIHKSHALRAREYVRLHCAPHMRVTRPA